MQIIGGPQCEHLGIREGGQALIIALGHQLTAVTFLGGTAPRPPSSSLHNHCPGGSYVAQRTPGAGPDTQQKHKTDAQDLSGPKTGLALERTS